MIALVKPMVAGAVLPLLGLFVVVFVLVLVVVELVQIRHLLEEIHFDDSDDATVEESDDPS